MVKAEDAPSGDAQSNCGAHLGSTGSVLPSASCVQKQQTTAPHSLSCRAAAAAAVAGVAELLFNTGRSSGATALAAVHLAQCQQPCQREAPPGPSKGRLSGCQLGVRSGGAVAAFSQRGLGGGQCSQAGGHVHARIQQQARHHLVPGLRVACRQCRRTWAAPSTSNRKVCMRGMQRLTALYSPSVHYRSAAQPARHMRLAGQRCRPWPARPLPPLALTALLPASCCGAWQGHWRLPRSQTCACSCSLGLGDLRRVGLCAPPVLRTPLLVCFAHCLKQAYRLRSLVALAKNAVRTWCGSTPLAAARALIPSFHSFIADKARCGRAGSAGAVVVEVVVWRSCVWRS